MSKSNHIGMVISAYKNPKIGHISHLGTMDKYPGDFSINRKQLKHTWGENVTIIYDTVFDSYRISISYVPTFWDMIKDNAFKVLMIEYLIYEYKCKRLLLPVKFSGPNAKLDYINWLETHNSRMVVQRCLDICNIGRFTLDTPPMWIIRKEAKQFLPKGYYALTELYTYIYNNVVNC